MILWIRGRIGHAKLLARGELEVCSVDVEGFNQQLRKVTKSKGVFPTDDSLLKMLYLATMDITKKWTGRRQDWGPIIPSLRSSSPTGYPAKPNRKHKPANPSRVK